MIDMHYDLLTIIYFYLNKNNKFYNPEKVQEMCKKIYKENNIKGGFINLYFTPIEEMISEIDISLEECLNLTEMFKTAITSVENFKNLGYIPKSTKFIYSIEGCDYIKSKEHLKELYNLGLRSILPVWNHQNQYGSGYRTNCGLSKKGEELINAALDLGIIIDVSHANIPTFNDILDLYEKHPNPEKKLIASHSNVKSLYDCPRNLTDEQLIRLNKLGGYIGLFTNSSFITPDFRNKDYEERTEEYLKHLDYLIQVIKFDPNRITVSTDDMNFDPDSKFHNKEAVKTDEIAKTLLNKISTRYNSELANKIVYENAQNLIDKVL